MERRSSSFSGRAPSGGYWAEPEADEQDRLMDEVLQKFRRFRPYLKNRLKKIIADGGEREFADLVDEIKYFLNVMNDLMADEHHGLETIQTFVENIQEMIRTDPAKPDVESILNSSDEDNDFGHGTSSGSVINQPGRSPVKRERHSRDSRNPYQVEDTRHLANDIWSAPPKDHLSMPFNRRSETDSRNSNDFRSHSTETLRCGGRGQSFQSRREHSEDPADNFHGLHRTSGRGKNIYHDHDDNSNRAYDRNSDRYRYRDTDNRNSEYGSKIFQDHDVGADLGNLYDRRTNRPRTDTNTRDNYSRRHSNSNSTRRPDNDYWDNDNDVPSAPNSSNSYADVSVPPKVTPSHYHSNSSRNQYSSSTSNTPITPNLNSSRGHHHNNISNSPNSNSSNHHHRNISNDPNSSNRHHKNISNVPNSNQHHKSVYNATNSSNQHHKNTNAPNSNIIHSPNTPINANVPLPPPAQLQELIQGMVASAIQSLNPQIQQQGVNPQLVTQLLQTNPNLAAFNVANNPTTNMSLPIGNNPNLGQNQLPRISKSNPNPNANVMGFGAPPYRYDELFPNQPSNQFRFQNPNARMFRPPSSQSQLYSHGKSNDDSNMLREIRKKAQQHFIRHRGIKIKQTTSRVDTRNPNSQRGHPRAPSRVASNQIVADPPVIADPRLRRNKANRNSQAQISAPIHKQSKNAESENESIDADAGPCPSKRRVEHSRDKDESVLKTLAETRKKVANSIPASKVNKVSKIAELRKEFATSEMVKLGNKGPTNKKANVENSTSPAKSSSDSSESQKSKMSSTSDAYHGIESELGSPEKIAEKLKPKTSKGAKYSSENVRSASSKSSKSHNFTKSASSSKSSSCSSESQTSKTSSTSNADHGDKNKSGTPEKTAEKLKPKTSKVAEYSSDKVHSASSKSQNSTKSASSSKSSKPSSSSSDSQKSKASSTSNADHGAENELVPSDKTKRYSEKYKNSKGDSSENVHVAPKSSKTTNKSKNLSKEIPNSLRPKSSHRKPFRIPKRGDAITDKPVYSERNSTSEKTSSSATAQDDSENVANLVRTLISKNMSSEEFERLAADPEAYNQILGKLQGHFNEAVINNKEKPFGLHKVSASTTGEKIKSCSLKHRHPKGGPRNSVKEVIEDQMLTAYKKCNKEKNKGNNTNVNAKKSGGKRLIPRNKEKIARKRHKLDSCANTNNTSENTSTEETSKAKSIRNGDFFPKRYLTRLQLRKIANPEVQPRDGRTGWEKWDKKLAYLRAHQKQNRTEMSKKFVATSWASKIKNKLKRRFISSLQQKEKKTRNVIGPNSIVINQGLCKIKIESDYIPPERVKTENGVEPSEDPEDADMGHLHFDNMNGTPKNSTHLNDNDEDAMMKVLTVNEEVKALGLKISEFESVWDPIQNFNYFEGILKKNLMKLNNIKADGRGDVQNAKQECVKLIQNYIEALKSKIPRPGGSLNSNETVNSGIPTVTQNLENPQLSSAKEVVENMDIPLEVAATMGTPTNVIPQNEDDSAQCAQTKISVEALNCSLCSFSGEKIVAHYVNSHRHSTIPQSRISQQEYDKLMIQNESISNDLLEITFANEKFPWLCLFCSEKYDDVIDYFEHVTTHTGEFRYACGVCSERYPYLKTVTTHLRNHELEETESFEKAITVLEPTVISGGNELFAYICNDCNYFQLLPENISRHLENENHSPSKAMCVKFKIQKCISAPINQESFPDVKIEGSENTLEHIVVNLPLRSVESTSKIKQEKLLEDILERSSIKIEVQESQENSEILKGSNSNCVETEKKRVPEEFSAMSKLVSNETQLLDTTWSEDVKCGANAVFIKRQGDGYEHTVLLKGYIPPAYVKLEVQIPECEKLKMRTVGKYRACIKDSACYKEMISPEKIKHLFKCMGKSCSYSGDCPKDFLLHFKCHGMKTEESATTEKEEENWTACAYCSLQYRKAEDLSNHIINQHSQSVYQCAYCFYRTLHKKYHHFHYSENHPLKNPVTFKCERVVSSDYVEPSSIKAFVYRCSRESCAEKSKKFLFRNEFIDHLQSCVPLGSMYRCHMCQKSYEDSNHLILHYKVHFLFRFQCFYCSFGTEEAAEANVHVQRVHPNMSGKVFDREKSNTKRKIVDWDQSVPSTSKCTDQEERRIGAI